MNNPDRFNLFFRVGDPGAKQGRFQGSGIASIVAGRTVPGGGNNTFVFFNFMIFETDIMQQGAPGSLGSAKAFAGGRHRNFSHRRGFGMQLLALLEDEFGNQQAAESSAEVAPENRVKLSWLDPGYGGVMVHHLAELQIVTLLVINQDPGRRPDFNHLPLVAGGLDPGIGARLMGFRCQLSAADTQTTGGGVAGVFDIFPDLVEIYAGDLIIQYHPGSQQSTAIRGRRQW